MDCIIQIIFFKSKFTLKIMMTFMKDWPMLESPKKSKKQTLLHIAIIAGSVSTAKQYFYNYMFKKDMNLEHIMLEYSPRL